MNNHKAVIRVRRLLQKTMAVLLAAVLFVGDGAGGGTGKFFAREADIASGTDWVLDADGKLTISSDEGMADWENYMRGDYEYYTRQVVNVEIQDGVTSLGNNAFYNYGELTGITIADSVTSIAGSAFCGCWKLRKITIPNNVTSISDRMFMNSGLEEITILGSVTSIGEYAFWGCGLTKITIPASVTSIGEKAFIYCDNLNEVIIKSETPPTLGDGVFTDCGFVKDNTQSIHVPTGKAQAYKDAWTDWEAYIANDTSSSEKTDFEKLIETIEVIMAALEDFTADNDTTAESIQSIIDAAVADAGITDAFVEVRDFQKIVATTEAEGRIQAAIYVRCGTREHTGSMEEEIERLQPSHTHTLTLTPAKPADCTKDGNEAYYTCSGCDKWFLDAAGTREITDRISVVIPMTGHAYDESAWGYQTADGHAHKCQKCDAHDEVKEHTPGVTTETMPQTCMVCGYEIAPATGTDPGSGTVTPEVKPGVNAPTTNISTSTEELKDMLLTEEEKQQLQNGTDIRIVLEVQDAGNTVSVSDQAAVAQALNGFTVGQYLNVDLYKLIGENRADITETAEKIRIVMAVPDSLKNINGNTARTFAVIRIHDGRAELLNDLDSSADTITIETDRFSTYAVVYQDKSNGGNGNTKPDRVKDNEPKTGDDAPLELYATLAMIAGFSYLLLYFTDRKRGITEETKRELVARLIAWAKRGGKLRKLPAFAAIFAVLVYYHSIGKNSICNGKEFSETEG